MGDTQGYLYFAQRYQYCYIHKCTSQVNFVESYGSGVCATGGDNVTSASFNVPNGIWGDTDGNIFVAEVNSYIVRKVSTITMEVTVYAGMVGTASVSATSTNGDGGPATDATMLEPYTLVGDSLGSVYVADCSAYKIRKIDANGIIATFAGTGVSSHTDVSGPATSTTLSNVISVWVSSIGVVYATEPSHLKMIDVSGIITTLTSGLNYPLGLYGDN